MHHRNRALVFGPSTAAFPPPPPGSINTAAFPPPPGPMLTAAFPPPPGPMLSAGGMLLPPHQQHPPFFPYGTSALSTAGGLPWYPNGGMYPAYPSTMPGGFPPMHPFFYPPPACAPFYPSTWSGQVQRPRALCFPGRPVDYQEDASELRGSAVALRQREERYGNTAADGGGRLSDDSMRCWADEDVADDSSNDDGSAKSGYIYVAGADSRLDRAGAGSLAPQSRLPLTEQWTTVRGVQSVAAAGTYSVTNITDELVVAVRDAELPVVVSVVAKAANSSPADAGHPKKQLLTAANSSPADAGHPKKQLLTAANSSPADAGNPKKQLLTTANGSQAFSDFIKKLQLTTARVDHLKIKNLQQFQQLMMTAKNSSPAAVGHLKKTLAADSSPDAVGHLKKPLAADISPSAAGQL